MADRAEQHEPASPLSAATMKECVPYIVIYVQLDNFLSLIVFAGSMGHGC